LTYPPCVEHALVAMNSGEKISHAAKLLVSTYFLHIGKSVDEVIDVFKKDVDYKEKVTRYQIEHLAGLKGSHKVYVVPSCDRVLHQNLCYATDRCVNIHNPKDFK
jgi:DNA primase large subunit